MTKFPVLETWTELCQVTSFLPYVKNAAFMACGAVYDRHKSTDAAKQLLCSFGHNNITGNLKL